MQMQMQMTVYALVGKCTCREKYESKQGCSQVCRKETHRLNLANCCTRFPLHFKICMMVYSFTRSLVHWHVPAASGRSSRSSQDTVKFVNSNQQPDRLYAGLNQAYFEKHIVGTVTDEDENSNNESFESTVQLISAVVSKRMSRFLGTV